MKLDISIFTMACVSTKLLQGVINHVDLCINQPIFLKQGAQQFKSVFFDVLDVFKQFSKP